MKHTITILAAMIAFPAFATYDEPPKPEPRHEQRQPTQGQGQETNVIAGASVFSSPSATGQSVSESGASNTSTSRDRMYVLPAPVQAAALPAGFCDRRESVAIAGGWNAISYGSSTARIDDERIESCIKLVRAAQSPTPQQMAHEQCRANEAYSACIREVMSAFMGLSVQRDMAPINAAAVDLKPAAVIAKPPKKRTAVAGKTVAAQKCGATEVLRCVPRGM